MKKLGLLFLGVVLGLAAYGLIQSLPRHRTHLTATQASELKPVAAAPDEISNSRTNAIVVAAREVSPAVVSITVTQTRVVSNQFASPFGDDPFNWFFRDFGPPQQYKEQVKAMGSGLIVSPDGYVVTNAHVAEDATQITVTLPSGKQFDGDVVDVSDSEDLALVKINATDLPTVKLGNSDDAMIGEWAIALGNPFGYLMEDTRPTVTVGVVSATNRTIRAGTTEDRDYRGMIQTDAAINPGNSGGPLVNADAEVIGINTFIFTKSGGSEGVGFAIPINEVKTFVDVASRVARQAKTEAPAERVTTKIGATVSDINASLKRKYQLNVDQGVVVVDVTAGSIAEAANLEEGDVIQSVGNQTVKSAADFKVKADRIDRSLDMIISRQGSQIRMIYRY
jgi:serine protease Do